MSNTNSTEPGYVFKNGKTYFLNTLWTLGFILRKGRGSLAKRTGVGVWLNLVPWIRYVWLGLEIGGGEEKLLYRTGGGTAELHERWRRVHRSFTKQCFWPRFDSVKAWDGRGDGCGLTKGFYADDEASAVSWGLTRWLRLPAYIR
jgi:hypothetical protein